MTREEKFSEIERRVNAVLAGPICHYSVTVLANYMLAELEAAGQKWDPEEPELPRRLFVTWDSASIPYLAPSSGGEPFGTDERRDASYVAAARAYNILPEIEVAFRRWQAADYGNYSEDDLFAGVVRRLLGKDGGS